MERKSAGGAIRLTNRTAIALQGEREDGAAHRGRLFRRVARSARLAAASRWLVYLGMTWPPAVPLLLALAVATDALLALSARRMYLQLIGQAICTEAAARRIRAEKSEKQRRRQAVDDLVAMQRDAQRQTGAATEGDFADALGQTRRMPVVKSAAQAPGDGRRIAAAGRRASPSLRMIPPNRCSEEP